MMGITVSMNFWFLVSLCLVCAIIGGLLFNYRPRSDRYRY